MKSNKPVIVPKKITDLRDLTDLTDVCPTMYITFMGLVQYPETRVGYLFFWKERSVLPFFWKERSVLSILFHSFQKNGIYFFVSWGAKNYEKMEKNGTLFLKNRKERNVQNGKERMHNPAWKNHDGYQKMHNFMEIQKSQHSLVTKCTYKKFFQKSLKFWDFIGWKIMFLGNNSF